MPGVAAAPSARQPNKAHVAKLTCSRITAAPTDLLGGPSSPPLECWLLQLSLWPPPSPPRDCLVSGARRTERRNIPGISALSVSTRSSLAPLSLGPASTSGCETALHSGQDILSFPRSGFRGCIPMVFLTCSSDLRNSWKLGSRS